MNAHDPGSLPDAVTVVDDNGVPDFMFKLSDLDTTALQLAGAIAAHCDDKAKVSALLGQVAAANVGNPVYLSGLLLRALRFLAEDLFAPLLEVTEKMLPQHDYRGHLAAVADPTGEAWEGKEPPC